MQKSVARLTPAEEVRRLGSRAVRAVNLAAGGGDWSHRSVLEAARALGEGSRTAGVTRPWPRLSASLRRIGSQWLAQSMKVGG